jgi:hypothetical protein
MGLTASPWALGAPAWVGTADYLAAPGATGDEESIGPFDSYDFANGVSLLKQTSVTGPSPVNVGDTFVGYYQSYVNAHQLNGVAVVPSVLNTAGAGPGYELTVTATYQTTVTTVTPFGFFFSVTGGSASLQFDPNPNYSFTGDSGFSDGTSILTGTIVSGTGGFVPVAGVGFSDVILNIGLGGYNQAVYEPDTIAGGSGIFTLKLNTSGTGPTAGVTSVMGVAVAGGFLEEADGNLSLTVVPLPAAVWLLGAGFLGYLGIGRVGRRDKVVAG